MTNRVYGWRPDTPDPRDRVFAAAPLAAATIPNRVDLRSHCSPVENQGQVGSCTGNAIAGAIELLDRMVDNAYTDVSRLFIYYCERQLEGTVRSDAGAMIRTGIKVVSTLGAPPEKLWPYVEANWRKKPPAAAYKAAVSHKLTSFHRAVSLRDVLVALSRGCPVVFGFTVFESFESDRVAKTGEMPMPDVSRERDYGGHAVLAVGYDFDKKHLIVRNSWGPDWGAGGYFYMPFGIVEDKNLSDDFWVVVRGQFN